MTISLVAVLITLAFTDSAHAGGRVDVTAASPIDMTEADLGLLVDADFRPLDDHDRNIAKGHPDSRTTPGETRGQWVRESATDVLHAEAQAWAGVYSISASGSARATRQYAFYRAYQTDTVIALDSDSMRKTPVPAGAEWYVSALYVGSMYEVVCDGDETAIEGAISGGVNAVVSGGTVTVGGGTTSSKLNCGFRMLSLKPKEEAVGKSLFLSNTADVEADYEVIGDKRVVMVRYSKIPPELMPQVAPSGTVATGSAKFTVTLQSVLFPGTKPDGYAWDIMGGAPDIYVNGYVGETRAYTNYSSPAYDSFSTNIGAVLATGWSYTSSVSAIRIDLYDSDMSDNDPAGRVTLALENGVVPPDGVVELKSVDYGTVVRLLLTPE